MKDTAHRVELIKAGTLATPGAKREKTGYPARYLVIVTIIVA